MDAGGRKNAVRDANNRVISSAGMVRRRRVIWSRPNNHQICRTVPVPVSGETAMAQSKTLNVNGVSVTVPFDDPDMPLLYALRNDLALHGPRFGCGLGQCGACTVHLDGRAVRSCIVAVSAVAEGQTIVTLEGLGTPDRLHPVQKAFIDAQAAQCGYCINGMIMESAAFLATHPSPSEAEIRQALANNLCRCGTHVRIVDAVKRAATSI
jgi:nicotinate dehydrogenase subunit A